MHYNETFSLRFLHTVCVSIDEFDIFFSRASLFSKANIEREGEERCIHISLVNLSHDILSSFSSSIL